MYFGLAVACDWRIKGLLLGAGFLGSFQKQKSCLKTGLLGVFTWTIRGEDML